MNNIQKKLLILGGTYFQIPAIEYAKKQDYYVITCDYLPENPGHKLADEYHNVSTTDCAEVLNLARSLKIDGILCFASDPAAPTAAYVSEELHIPGNSYDNICLLGEKHLWRKFLKDNGFNTPKAISYSSISEIREKDWSFPVMVKPVDSSGSKGVKKVNDFSSLKDAFNYALEFSRIKRVIIEEFIERVGPQIGGDGFYGTDGLVFACLGDQVVDMDVNPYVPCGMKFPSKIPKKTKENILTEIEKAISLSGLKNLSFNIEVMLDKEGRIYLMELGPRNGGNCIPEVIYNYTGVDMVALAVEAAMGNTIRVQEQKKNQVYAYYALHSHKQGIYQGYTISPQFKGTIKKSYIFVRQGDEIGIFNGSNQTIGILLLEFNDYEDMDSFFEQPSLFIQTNICRSEITI